QAMYGEDDDLRAVDVHAGQQCGFAVAADGHGVATIGGVVEQPAEEDEAQDGDQDGYRYAEQLPAAEDEEVLVHHPHRFAVGKDVGQAANDLHGRQRGDQRVDTQLGDHDAVDQPHREAHRQRRGNSQENAVGVTHHHRRDYPCTGDDRTYGKVEVAGRQA